MAAIRTVEELSKDLEFSGYYDLEEAHKQELEDMLNTGIRQGKEAGYSSGISDGINKGSKEKSIEIAKNMLEEDVPLDKIAKYTGLSIEEIEKIKI